MKTKILADFQICISIPLKHYGTLVSAIIDINSEAVVQSCSVKKIFLEISQNSQENICARVSFLIKLQN